MFVYIYHPKALSLSLFDLFRAIMKTILNMENMYVHSICCLLQGHETRQIYYHFSESALSILCNLAVTLWYSTRILALIELSMQGYVDESAFIPSFH